MTGDLGRLDAEGYLRITGRKKDIIIRGGRNIHPAPIEALAMRHAAVEKAAAFPVLDARLGERICLAVVTRADMPLISTSSLNFCPLTGWRKMICPNLSCRSPRCR